jgi:hypothetical protein
MSDGRWIDVDTDMAAAIGHFGKAVEIYRRAGFDAPGLEGYKTSASFQFAVQAGHTAAEAALKRIMDILKEERPTGEESHKDIIVRLSRPRTDEYARPALFTEVVSKDLLETMRARHRARHSYDDFDAAKAEPAVEAIVRLLTSLPTAVAEFRKKVDPEAGDDHDGGGDGAGGGMSSGPT